MIPTFTGILSFQEHEDEIYEMPINFSDPGSIVNFQDKYLFVSSGTAFPSIQRFNISDFSDYLSISAPYVITALTLLDDRIFIAYNSGISDNTVRIGELDPESMTLTLPITFSTTSYGANSGPFGFGITNDGQYLYINSQGPRSTLWKIDPNSYTVVSELIPSPAIWGRGFAIAYSSEDGFLYACSVNNSLTYLGNPLTNWVLKIDRTNFTEVSRNTSFGGGGTNRVAFQKFICQLGGKLYLPIAALGASISSTSPRNVTILNSSDLSLNQNISDPDSNSGQLSSGTFTDGDFVYASTGVGGVNLPKILRFDPSSPSNSYLSSTLSPVQSFATSITFSLNKRIIYMTTMNTGSSGYYIRRYYNLF